MQTTGIFIEQNAKGIPTFARIDLKKYGTELKEFFFQKGITLETPNDETEVSIKESYNLKKTKKYSSGSSLLADCLS